MEDDLKRLVEYLFCCCLRYVSEQNLYKYITENEPYRNRSLISFVLHNSSTKTSATKLGDIARVYDSVLLGIYIISPQLLALARKISGFSCCGKSKIGTIPSLHTCRTHWPDFIPQITGSIISVVPDALQVYSSNNGMSIGARVPSSLVPMSEASDYLEPLSKSTLVHRNNRSLGQYCSFHVPTKILAKAAAPAHL
jgi:hypothetical protein